LRARGELVEVRAADLRFTADEAAAYLNDVMGLDLNAPDVTVLGDRTEGWIAALQLAALSMRGRDDAAGFIAHFAGDRSPRSKRVCACDRTGWAKPSPGHELTTCRRKTG
jgi:ATP/maltotriose-dependent transcriptional regulator MalT